MSPVGERRWTTCVIIGGGHSGLAMSKRLADRGIDHVVLERGRAGESWRSQRWDSFTLLTPNWQTRLPGGDYEGDDPDGFMTGPEVTDFIVDYGRKIAAPIEEHTAVESVRASNGGYEVVTSAGPWHCDTVVVASGANNRPRRPGCAEAVPDGIVDVNPLDYRRPADLPDGGVMVVGAAATGIQLAEELALSGRPVILSLGEHVRMPRVYRGRDIQHWMEAIGRLDERYDEVEELRRARQVASPQLIGSPERRTLDLNRLTDLGVQLRGRLGTIRDGVALFSGGLRNHCALADQKLGRLLDEIDRWIAEQGLDGEVGAPQRDEPTRVPKSTPLMLDLTKGEIRSIVWATGFQPDLSWLDLPVFDSGGRIRHDGGVVDAPGVYLLGGSFLRRRRSSFIHGAPADSEDLAEHLAGYLAGHATR